MRKRIFLAGVVLLLGCLVGPLVLRAQSRATFTRTALSRMNVLSRAALFEKLIADAARKEDVDPMILWTIAYNETRFRPWLTSPRRAQGMMQFIPATASRFGLSDPYEPNASIGAAARYVKYLGELFEWRVDSVLAAYNSGEGTVAAYLQGKTIRSNGKLINPSGLRTIGGVPPYRETIKYVSRGLKIYRWLETHGKFQQEKNEVPIYAANKTTRLKQDIPEDENGRNTAERISVLYDPRTGRRFLVDGSGQRSIEPIIQDGPVIISPDLRGIPSQKARSTFTGISRP